MRPLLHCYELAYDNAGNVLDHSPLSFDGGLPGEPHFERMLAHYRKHMLPDALTKIRKWTELEPMLRGWMKSDKVNKFIDMPDHRLGVEWTLCEEGYGVLTLSADREVAKISVLIATPDHREDRASSVLLSATSKFMAEKAYERRELFKLADMTRRPLIASVNFPPLVDDGSDVRTAQRMLAYAFFKHHGLSSSGAQSGTRSLRILLYNARGTARLPEATRCSRDFIGLFNFFEIGIPGCFGWCWRQRRWPQCFLHC